MASAFCGGEVAVEDGQHAIHAFGRGTKWVTSAQSAEIGPPTANLGQVSRGNVCCQIAAKNDQRPSLISPEGPLTCTYFVAGTGFEPVTSGIDRAPARRYLKLRNTLGNLG